MIEIIASSTTLEWIAGLGTGSGALAGAFAASVAVYVGVLQAQRRRPVLTAYAPEHGRELIVLKRPSGDDEAAWLRLRIGNSPGKLAAEDVEVVIERVQEKQPRSGFPPLAEPPVLTGLALAWSATQNRQIRAHIAPGTDRIIDLAAVRRSEAASRGGPLLIQTAYIHADAERSHAMKTGVVELDLVISARNTDAVRYRVELAYDGIWGDDVWQALSFEGLERLTA